jgi:hypothetical protein
MNVEIGTEAAQFPEKEYINGIFVAVSQAQRFLRPKRMEESKFIVSLFLLSVFRIRGVLIRVRILRSVHWITDPATCFSGFQDATKKRFFAY